MDTDGKRLRLLYPDIHGLERGKYLFGDWGSTGMAAFCIGVYPLTHDKEILAIPRTQFDVGLHDVEAMLDRESLRPGWEANTVIGLADVELHGQPAPWTPATPSGRRADPGRTWGSSRRSPSSSSSTCWSRTRTAGGSRC